MSKIKNGWLDQYGDEPFEQQQFGTAGVEGVNWLALLDSRFILIHSVPIYLSIYLCLSAYFRRHKRLQRPAICCCLPSVAYGQTAVYVIYFPAHCAGVTNTSPRDNLSPAVKICRRHRRMKSNSASQKDYRLVSLSLMIYCFVMFNPARKLQYH